MYMLISQVKLIAMNMTMRMKKMMMTMMRLVDVALSHSPYSVCAYIYIHICPIIDYWLNYHEIHFIIIRLHCTFTYVYRMVVKMMTMKTSPRPKAENPGASRKHPGEGLHRQELQPQGNNQNANKIN